MRIAAFDIETTHLEADWGRMLCACFCPILEEGKLGEVTTFVKPVRRKDPLDDSALANAVRDEIEKYHMIVTWNGKLFDLPFLNARLLKAGARDCNPQLHLDLMWYATGNSMRAGSRRLDNIARYFRCEEQKTDVDREVWQRARCGDPDAMKQVVEHCEADVKVLSQVYWHLIPRVRNIHR